MDGDRGRALRRALIVVGVVVAVVVGGVALWISAEVFLLAFAAALIAIFLRALAHGLSRLTHLPLRVALVVVLFVLTGLIGLFWIWVGPQLATQFAELQERIPEALESLRERLAQSGWGRVILDLVPLGERGQPSAAEGADTGSVLAGIGAAFSTAFGILTDFVFVIFVSLFFAFNPDIYIRGALRLCPPAHRARARDLLRALGDTLRSWLLGQFFAMCIVGVMVGVGLWILGMPLALMLAFIAFSLELIPIVGPTMAAVPGILLATTEGLTMAVAVTSLYVVVQIIENNLIMPLIQQRMVYLPPALVLAATFVAGLLFGFVGVLVATPLLAAIVVVVKMLYVEDVLHEPIRLPHGWHS